MARLRSQSNLRSPGNASTYLKIMIPLYGVDRSLRAWITQAQLDSIKYVVIMRNKRGHVTRAYLTGTTELRPISQLNAGQAYKERLSCGRIWQLRKPKPANRNTA